ncbi:MAG: helix-turn-helix domain-containing protein, partial [Anaerolineae bacterium]
MPKADLLLHPVRLRIATELANRTQTPAQLGAALPDVAQATLYRHINLLLEGGLIEVAGETPVNGALERSYRLAQGAGTLTPEELHGATRGEHVRYFTIFAASLIEAFTRYVQHTEPGTVGQDGMSYNRATLYLNAQERADFQREVVGLVERYLSLPPAPDRERFT